MKSTNSPWESVSEGIVRFRSSGTLFTYFRKNGKPERKSCETSDLATAKRLLAQRRLEPEKKLSEIRLADLLKRYEGTLGKLADSSRERRVYFAKRMLSEFGNVPVLEIKTSAVETLLNTRIQNGGAKSTYNEDLRTAKDVFAVAVRDGCLSKSPLDHLKQMKRDTPIRDTPSEEEFTVILESIGSQKENRDRQDTVNFVEFMGKAGIGNSEAAALKVKHVDFDRREIKLYRNKTDTGFVIPLFPAVRPLLERLCAGKNPSDSVFAIGNARKALTNACKRLQLPNYGQRSLRRMFITKAIYLNIPVPTIAAWQGHKDGGTLILKVYGQTIARMNSDLAEKIS